MDGLLKMTGQCEEGEQDDGDKEEQPEGWAGPFGLDFHKEKYRLDVTAEKLY